MRILPIAVLVSVCLLEGAVSAQEKPDQKEDTRPPYTSEAMLRRIRGVADDPAATKCVLPDETEHAVNTTAAFKGRAYRCVEVLDQNLHLRGLAWTSVLERE